MISTVADAVIEKVTRWQQRPLDPVYPVVLFDCLRVKIRDEGVVRNKAVYVALGVDRAGRKDVLGVVDRAHRSPYAPFGPCALAVSAVRRSGSA